MKADNTYNFFISYASEDTEFAGNLADVLFDRGFTAWFGPSQLKVGDSLVQRINEGLQQAHHGIVCVSRSFLAKPWPMRELHALVSLMIGDKAQKVIPILIDIDHTEYISRLPLLSDILYLEKSAGLDRIANALGALFSVEKGDILPKQRVVVEDRGQVSTYDDLIAALNSSSDSATIYLYPGNYTLKDKITGNKTIVSRGSQTETIINIPMDSAIVVSSGALKVQGVTFRGDDINEKVQDEDSEAKHRGIQISDDPGWMGTDVNLFFSDTSDSQIYLRRCKLVGSEVKRIGIGTIGTAHIEDCDFVNIKHAIVAAYGGKVTCESCSFANTKIGIYDESSILLSACKGTHLFLLAKVHGTIRLWGGEMHSSCIHAHLESFIGIGGAARFEDSGNEVDFAVLYLNHYSRGEIANCSFDGGQRTLYLYGGSYISAERVNINAAKGRGIYFSEGCSGILSNCTIAESGEHGVYLQKGADPRIKNCTIRDNKGVGLFLTMGGKIDLENSQVSGNAGGGIVAESGQVSLIGTKIFLNGAPGVSVTENVSLLMDSCEIGQNSHGGVHVGGREWVGSSFIERILQRAGIRQTNITNNNTVIY